MTSSRPAFMKCLTVIAILSTVLLVSISPALQATSTSQISVIESTVTENNSGSSSISVGPGYRVGSFPVGLQSEKLLVIKAKLSDKDFTTPMAQINMTMSSGVRSYYEEVSYNQTVIVSTIIPKNYTMPKSEYDYGLDSGTNEPNVEKLVEDALTAAKSDVDSLGNYSIFKHIVVVHSGDDEAMPPNDPAAITSQFIYREGGALFTIGGVKIMNACVVSDKDPLGVIVHELGHSMGLPDLYDYSIAPQGHGDDFVGPWDLMAEGSWNPRPYGTSPSHQTTWGKIKLGWITPSKIVNINQSSIQSGHNVTVLLAPEELNSGTIAIRILLNNGTYYLVESRWNIGYDAALPSGGVLVLYCDDSKLSGHGPVRLMNAHVLDLSKAPYNVGVPGYYDFFGDQDANIGVKVLNKWTNNGTFKILVGQWTPVYNAPSEYVGSTNIPLAIVIVGCAVFLIVVLVVYLKKGRKKTPKDSGSVPVIRIS